MAKGRIRNAIKKKIRRRSNESGSTSASGSVSAAASKAKSGGRRLKSMTKSVTKSATVRVMRRIGTVKEAFHSIDAQMKLHRFKIREFQPKFSISLKKGHFTVKTVETGEELEDVLRLRFEVFNREYMGKNREVGVDVDKLDYICDHLIIRDDRQNRIVGTYRLNSSRYSDVFYSASEFHFEKIQNMPGTILELGRAAIDKDYRTGVVIALLWRGISEYMLKTETDILIGCASVKTMEPLQIGLVTHHLEKAGALRYNHDVEPTRKYRVKTLPKVLEYIEKNPFEYDAESVEKLIPALFHSYIKMGFKAYGEPAIDRDFKCIDYFIMMRVDELEGAYGRRYAKKEGK